MNKTANAPASKARRQVHFFDTGLSQFKKSLEVKHGVFSLEDPKEIALSLKKSAEVTTRRKVRQ